MIERYYTITDLAERLAPFFNNGDAIRRYIKAGLAPGPIRRGPAPYRAALYPETVLEELLASYILVQSFPRQRKAIAKARELALARPKPGVLAHVFGEGLFAMPADRASDYKWLRWLEDRWLYGRNMARRLFDKVGRLPRLEG